MKRGRGNLLSSAWKFRKQGSLIMRVAEKLLNKTEEVAFRELSSIAEENALRLFAKPRLSDVIVKDELLAQADFDFYTRAHVDFVVTDQETKPLFIVEYDGLSHTDPVQQRRDNTKDGLCAKAGLGILRINANHVMKLYRGMSVLRWIIEVTELEKAFYAAQEAGQVPWDEPFDPAMFISDGKGRNWPYWLSISATQSLNTFVHESKIPAGWAGIHGHDKNNNMFALDYCWRGDQVIWSKTAIRKQDFQFPVFDLLTESSRCELDLQLQKYKKGQVQPVDGRRLRSIFEEFCSRYQTGSAHSCGGMGPEGFNCSWKLNSGWTFE